MAVELEDGRRVTVHHGERADPVELIVSACDTEGRVVGVAIADDDRAGDAVGASVQVAPEWRGVGLGRLLLHELTQQASLAGIPYLLGTYPEDNVAATEMIARLDEIVARRVARGMVKVAIDVPTHGRAP